MEQERRVGAQTTLIWDPTAVATASATEPAKTAAKGPARRPAERPAESPAASPAAGESKATSTGDDEVAERPTDADERPTAAERAEVEAALALFACGSSPNESETQRAQRLGLGKETLQVLAPLVVRRVARSAPPPRRRLFTPELALVAAVVAAAFTSASVAFAWG